MFNTEQLTLKELLHFGIINAGESACFEQPGPGPWQEQIELCDGYSESCENYIKADESIAKQSG